MPHKVGRPASLDPQNHRVPARFTASERAELERRALLAGVSVAELLRRGALGDGSPAEALSLSPLIARRA